MKIDLDALLLDLDDQPIYKKEEVPWSVRTVLCHALTAVQEGYKPESAEKFEDYTLAMDIKKAGKSGDDINFSIKEANHCRECVCRTFNTLIYGQIHGMFEKSASGKAVDNALKS